MTWGIRVIAINNGKGESGARYRAVATNAGSNDKPLCYHDHNTPQEAFDCPDAMRKAEIYGCAADPEFPLPAQGRCMEKALDRLVDTGLYGANKAEVADFLIRRAIIGMMQMGEISAVETFMAHEIKKKGKD